MKRPSTIIIFMVFIWLVAAVSYAAENKKNVLFLSDLHACIDSKNRNISWTENSSKRIYDMLHIDHYEPSDVIFVGDLIDFLPKEWNIVHSWIVLINRFWPRTKIHAVMGNHDYFYYKYPDIVKNFNTPTTHGHLSYEVETSLRMSVKKMGNSLIVENCRGFIVGHQVIIIEDHGDGASKFFITYIKDIDAKNNIIYIRDNLPEEFTSSIGLNDVFVRQGETERRGIISFLNTFRAVGINDTKQIFYVGNICFILMSMDAYYSFNPTTGKTKGITDADFSWLESNIKTQQNDKNIIVVMHELPNSGKNLSGIYCSDKSIDYNDETINKFNYLISKYRINVWISGHNHPNAKMENIYSVHNNTLFLLIPSLGTNIEGQALELLVTDKAKKLIFRYFTTKNNLTIKYIEMQANFSIKLPSSE